MTTRRAFIAVLSLAAPTVLWTAGLVATPHPALLAVILAMALASGLATLRLGLAGGRRSFATLAGAASLAAIVLFLAALFHKPDGSAAISRRVGEAVAGVTTLRLVNFNVLHGYPGLYRQEERYRVLAASLRALAADVVVLQEAWSTARHGELAARLGRDLRLDAAYAPANGSRRLIGFEEGAAVLSRLPIVAARRVRLEPREAFWASRIALAVTLALGSGETLTVVGTHLADRAPEIADHQARHLAGLLPQADWVIVAGDFNAESGSAAVRALTARGLRDVVPGGIDHVLVGPMPSPWTLAGAGWTLRRHDLADLVGEEVEISDHPGIVVDLVRGARWWGARRHRLLPVRSPLDGEQHPATDHPRRP